jgi:cellulose synthase/poly-beta-1,6-N-acetylglucosamine synthase-like glycosyltransferase
MTILVLSTCAFCVIATVLHLASLATVLQRIRRSDAEVNGTKTLEGISIIRPVCGVENFSEETLLSGFHLDYPRYELLFCAAQSSDPVVPFVRRLIQLHPHVTARLLIGNECISANPKLNNVVKGWVAASHPWIVMADSNVLMPPDYLHRLLATWRPDTGLVSSPAIGCTPGNMWPNWNARSSTPTRRAGNVLATASEWALRKARRCCFAATAQIGWRHSRTRFRSGGRRGGHQARSQDWFARACR